MWCTHSTMTPRCLLIRRSVTRRSHCTIWSTLQSVSGSATWGGRPGLTRSSVLLLPSLNFLHHSSMNVNGRPLVLHLPRKETGWRSDARVWTNPRLSAVQHAVVQRYRRTPHLWCVPEHCRTGRK
jgi:hypothetical protein